MKVDYLSLEKWWTTGYLNDHPNSDGSYSGFNKHTDDPIRVVWNGESWIEIPQ